LNECRAVLGSFGGHAMAAGLDLDEKDFDRFKQLFNEAAGRELKDKNLAPTQAINAWIRLDEVSEENFKALEKLAPFGQDNPKPVFAVRGLKVAGTPRVVGKKHLRFCVSDGKLTFNAIAFNHAQSVMNRADGASGGGDRKFPEGLIDIAFRIQKNTFNGADNLELHILDYRSSRSEE